MNRRWLLAALGALPLIVDAGSLDSLTSMVSDPLVGSLKSKLGVTDSQAKGGVGSLLTLAQEHLNKGDFDKIATLLPGTQKYLDAAKSLGAVKGPVKDAAGLNSAYSRLGIKPETAAKFTPMVLDAVGKVGGDSARSLLAGALK
ncbi:MAG TPA: DUF2780 domain-containing protein [Steroidobacteraceae bacterium]|nr:DUF2780 domain-containing protein [Steroidobacteraceae bacterium]